MDHTDPRSTFIAGMIIGGILALCGVKIYQDQQEIEVLETKIDELTSPNPRFDR